MVKSILVVDDNALHRRLLARALIDDGYAQDILMSESGEDGLLKVKQYAPDLVILDTLLKGMDGFATCQQMKTANPKIKVILLTGSLEAVDEPRAKACGADEFTVKGEHYSALMSTYHKLIEQLSRGQL